MEGDAADMNDPIFTLLAVAIVAGIVLILKRRHQHGRFAGEMQERKDGMAGQNRPDGECVGAQGRGGRMNDFNRFTEAVAKEANK